MHLGAALFNYYCEVELLIRCEGFAAYQILINSEYAIVYNRSEGMGAKVRAREEKNPDHQLRSRNNCSVELTKSDC